MAIEYFFFRPPGTDSAEVSELDNTEIGVTIDTEENTILIVGYRGDARVGSTLLPYGYLWRKFVTAMTDIPGGH